MARSDDATEPYGRPGAALEVHLHLGRVPLARGRLDARAHLE
jgi:hypothetical protein